MAVGGHSGAGRAMSMPAQSVAAGAASTSSSTPAPTTATAAKATAITMGLHALCTVAMVVPGLFAPVAAADFGADPSRLGVVVAIFYLGIFLSSLACGMVLARMGDLRAAQLSGWLCALGMVLTALAGWGAAGASTGETASGLARPVLLAGGLFALLFAASLSQGLGYGMLNPVGSQILFRATPAEIRSFVFSIKQSAVPAGQMLAGLIIPTLLLFFGWQSVVLGVGLMILAYTVAMNWMRLETSAAVHAPADAAAQAHAKVTGGGMARAAGGGRLSEFLAPAKIVWNTPALRELGWVGMTYSVNQLCFLSFLVSYLNLEIGMSLVLAGSLFAASQVGGMLGRLTWGFVADRWVTPRLQLGVLGVVGSACGMLLALFTTAWPLAIMAVISVIYGATAASWNGVYFAEIARLCPRDQVGRLTGGLQFYMSVGGGLGPLLFSLLVGIIGTYGVGFAVFSLPALYVGLRLMLPRKFAAT